jgi:hypothetical protein
MHSKPGPKFWVLSALCAVSTLLFAVTLVWPDWIELVFGADPDAGDGTAEWLVVAASLTLSVFFLWASRREWRRHGTGALEGTLS